MAQFVFRSEKNSNPIYDDDRLLISSIGERPKDTRFA
jgi:hypothetical protein